MKKEKLGKGRILLTTAAWLGLALVLALTLAAGKPLVEFASQPEAFREWVRERGIWGILAYMAMVIVQILVALIPGEPFEIAAGYAFGTWAGTGLYLLAAFLGSLLVFLLVRRFGRALVEMLFPRKKLDFLRFLRTDRRRELLFALVFMLPGTPKDLLCYFAGLTDMPLGAWLLICSLGRIPSVITSTLGGDALGEQNYLLAGVIFLSTLAVSGGGLLLFNRLAEKKNKD